MKTNWFIFALCFSSTSSEKTCLLSVAGFETQFQEQSQKRQVFCIGMYNSEIWMETHRLNWYVSHPLWSLPPLQSQSGSHHTQMWQVSFLRWQKFKVWLLKLKYPWTIVPILKKHFTQFSLTESRVWRLPLFLEMRFQIAEPMSTASTRIINTWLGELKIQVHHLICYECLRSRCKTPQRYRLGRRCLSPF